MAAGVSGSELFPSNSEDVVAVFMNVRAYSCKFVEKYVHLRERIRANVGIGI